MTQLKIVVLPAPLGPMETVDLSCLNREGHTIDGVQAAEVNDIWSPRTDSSRYPTLYIALDSLSTSDPKSQENPAAPHTL